MGEARGTRRGRLRLLLLAVAILATGFTHARMDTSTPAGSGQLRVPDPRVARLASLGFDPLLADWFWVQALQLVGGELHDIGPHANTIADAIELITSLDPWVDHPYRFAAIWLTATLDQVRRANGLLSKAISYHPRDWRNRFYLGYNQFFYFEENMRAAQTLESTLHMPGAPAYLGSLVTRLRAENGDLETAAGFLQELIRTAPDEYARAEYGKAYDEIMTERLARQLDQARAAFQQRHGRDVHEPAELWEGPLRVMRAAPPAHPHFEGFVWEIDPEDGQIVSSFYKSRYRLHIHPTDERLREGWREELGTGAAQTPAAQSEGAGT
jgi:hypothetical protein